MMRVESLENGTVFRVWTPAKVNLFFEILGKRPDGYHEVETLVAPIDLFDRLDFFVDSKGAEPGLKLECFDAEGRPEPEVPTDERNLVSRAYSVFVDNFGKDNINVSLRARIFKKIPTKAGLGGGSSDAAATFAVLNVLFGSPFTKTKLQKLAGCVGSDVPLFLEDGASIGRGRGEIVAPFELPELHLLVLKPEAGLGTADVYRRYSTLKSVSKRSLNEYCESIRGASAAETARIVAEGAANRLEEAASTLWDGVERRRSLLLSIPDALCARMSGSGTAFFAIYPSEQSANAAFQTLRARIEQAGDDLLNDRLFVVKTLGRLSG